MKLHTPGETADWERIKPNDRGKWQKLAAASRGVLTPSNVISVAGLILVMWGLINVAYGNYLSGAIMIAIGRLFDLLDGMVAELTKTKSPLGESVDSTIDKIEIFIALSILVIIQIVPSLVVIFMLAFSIWVTLIAIIARIKNYRLHPSLLGKLSTASAWTSIIIFIFDNALAKSNDLLINFGYVFFGIFGVLGLIAAIGYSSAALSNISRANRLINSFGSVLAVYNPTSSNKGRAKARIKEIQELSGKKVTLIKTDKNMKIFAKRLELKLKSSERQILLLLGGGDGTVHDTLNIILNFKSDELRNDIVVLPLWSGNANDFAYMLNGLSFNKRMSSVFSGGNIISFRPLKIDIKNSKKQNTFYAICYASFGAIAYVAKELDKKSVSSKGMFRSIPLAVMIREVLSVIGAFRQAPTFKASVNGKKVKIFEEAFTKGSRIAKINTVPIKLTDNAYFHINQTEEHPLLSRRIVQIITGKKFGEIISKPTKFKLSNSTLAQFDGEVHKIKKNSKISVSLSTKKIKALSIKLG